LTEALSIEVKIEFLWWEYIKYFRHIFSGQTNPYHTPRCSAHDNTGPLTKFAFSVDVNIPLFNLFDKNCIKRQIFNKNTCKTLFDVI
jgi:hypothetical protein